MPLDGGVVCEKAGFAHLAFLVGKGRKRGHVIIRPSIHHHKPQPSASGSLTLTPPPARKATIGA
jgi:hypothetical protein